MYRFGSIPQVDREQAHEFQDLLSGLAEFPEPFIFRTLQRLSFGCRFGTAASLFFGFHKGATRAAL
jgi:hypothetical protein